MGLLLASTATGVATQRLLDRLEVTIAPTLPSERRYYGWQPLPLLDFYRGMEVLGAGAGRQFLDVGSGIGCKMFLAAELGFVPSGIERHSPYLVRSRRLFPQFSVVSVDAFHFTGYADFDVVYCYRPCVDPAVQDHLNRYIADRMKPDALFFSAGGPYPDWLEHVGGEVWRSR